MLADPVNMINWLPAVKESGVPFPATELVPVCYDTVGDMLDAKTTPRVKEFIDRMHVAVKKMAGIYGWPVFIRNTTMSGKHEWKHTCFVEENTNIIHNVFNIMQHNGMAWGASMPTHFAVRAFIKSSPAFVAFGGMPITDERRLFVKDGEVVCNHPYWPEEAFDRLYDPLVNATGRELTEEDWKLELYHLNKLSGEDEVTLKHLAEKVSARIKGYWSVDFLKGSDDIWYLIDMAPGSRSYHWRNCEHGVKQ